MTAQKRLKLRNLPLDSKLLKVSSIFYEQLFKYLFIIDANKFKEAFEAAKKFNQLLKDGKTEELVYAPVVEDIEEVEVDDPEKNKTAGGDDDNAGGDDE